jgi:hypothetical protein
MFNKLPEHSYNQNPLIGMIEPVRTETPSSALDPSLPEYNGCCLGGSTHIVRIKGY